MRKRLISFMLNKEIKWHHARKMLCLSGSRNRQGYQSELISSMDFLDFFMDKVEKDLTNKQNNCPLDIFSKALNWFLAFERLRKKRMSAST
jgi:hypothetical protein